MNSNGSKRKRIVKPATKSVTKLVKKPATKSVTKLVKKQIKKYAPKNIVIEGGGVKGVAAIGTLRAMESRNTLKGLTRFCGTSAGALIALLLSIGYTVDEMNDVLLNMNMNELLDDSFGLARDLYRTYYSFGFYKGKALSELIRTLIYNKTQDANITFAELHQMMGNDLIAVVTNVSKDRADYMCHYTHPNTKVCDAIRASMGLPNVYVPINDSDDDLLVDGGVSNNFPIGVFDGNYPDQMDNLYNEVTKTDINNTIGLKFMAANETRSKQIYPHPQKIGNIAEFNIALLMHVMNRMERQQIKYGYWERTLSIPTGEIGTMQFDLTKEQKIEAQHLAEVDANAQLDYREKHGHFPTE
jgi:NTE family protein